MPLLLLPYLIQLGLAWHVYKTGRDMRWIYILILAPYLGGLIYIVMEILPEFLGSRRGRDMKKLAMNAIDPDRAYREAKRAYEDNELPQQLQNLAQAALESGRTDEAERLFRQAMTGINADDPVLRFGLAQSLGRLGRFAEAKAVAEEMRRDSPDFRRWQVSWLLGAAAEQLSDFAGAEAHLRDAYAIATEEGPRIALAKVLAALGKPGEARGIYEEIVKRAGKSPRQYVAANRKLIDEAREALKAG